MANVTLAVVAGLASAVAYGASTAVQHDVAHNTAHNTLPPTIEGSAAGGPDRGGLVQLLREPRWWASIGGDTVGFVLQLLALTLGPVVLVQPLFVLCLPVALPFRARLGGPRPTRAEYGWCVVLVAGLGLFFLLIGDPGEGRPLSTPTAVWLSLAALLIGAIAYLASARLPRVARAVALSAVTGVWFGTEAVLVNAVSRDYDRAGWAVFTRADGLVPLTGALVIGLLGFVLTQVAFQLGALGASFPAMLICDPVTAVVLGAALLAQRVPLGAAHVVGYAACLVAVALATVRLAAPPLDVPSGTLRTS